MPCADIQLLLPDYVLGILPESETEVVRAHLHLGCRQCEGALREILTALSVCGDEAAEFLPKGPTHYTALESCKQALLNRIRAEAPNDLTQRGNGNALQSENPVSTPPAKRHSEKFLPDTGYLWNAVGWVFALACSLLVGLALGSTSFFVQDEAKLREDYVRRIEEERKLFPDDTVSLVAHTVRTDDPSQIFVVWDYLAQQAHVLGYFPKSVLNKAKREAEKEDEQVARKTSSRLVNLWFSDDGLSWTLAGELGESSDGNGPAESTRLHGVFVVKWKTPPARMMCTLEREEDQASSEPKPLGTVLFESEVLPENMPLP